MPDCIDCKKFTKFVNGRCDDCFKKTPPFPPHAEFYKGLYKIEQPLLWRVFEVMGWQFSAKTAVGTYTTRMKIMLERYSWDVVIDIQDTPEPALAKEGNKGFYNLFVEYKSSVAEWGKHVHDFFRQINSKKERHNLKHTFLVSFDKSFLDYRHAFRMAEINLVVLSPKLLELIRK